MVDSEAESNIMTKTIVERLGLNYVQRNTRHKRDKSPPTLMCVVTQEVGIMLGKCQGKMNLTVTPLDIFDIILGKEFSQCCHAMIDPYLE